jgi:hypothetical protein
MTTKTWSELGKPVVDGVPLPEPPVELADDPFPEVELEPELEPELVPELPV